MKPQIQIDIEERARTHPCPKCGKANVDPETKFKFYRDECKHCGEVMNQSYLFAPWGQTWEYLQKQHDRNIEILNRIREISATRNKNNDKPN